MKPSEQLNEEQRNRVRWIAVEVGRKHSWSLIVPDVQRAILQALDELVPEMAISAARYRWLRKFVSNPEELDALGLSDPTTPKELDSTIDAAIAQEPKPNQKGTKT